MPLRPQSLHELLDMCLGGFAYSVDKLRGVGSFFMLPIYPAYLQNGFFLPERRFVKFRAHGTLVCSRNKNAGWPWNLATKCGGVVHTEGKSSPHLELMRIDRAARRPTDRRERVFPKVGVAYPDPPRPLLPA